MGESERPGARPRGREVRNLRGLARGPQVHQHVFHHHPLLIHLDCCRFSSAKWVSARKANL